jgi:uncharacterized protein (TIGR03066 family)
MRVILGCTLAVLVFNLSLSADDKKDEKIDAKKLIGKWEPKDKKEGMTLVIEFLKDGKVTISASGNGKDVKFDGTYKVDGNKLTMTMKFGEKEQDLVRTVTKLTDTDLTSTDEKGKEDTLVRIKDKQ